MRDNTLVQKEQQRQSGDTFIFRYEDLMDNIEGTLEAICRHVDVPYDPRMLEYHKDERAWFGASAEPGAPPPEPKDHAKLRNWQIKQPIMERRGQWKAHLDKMEIREIEDSCGDLMAYYGYPLEDQG